MVKYISGTEDNRFRLVRYVEEIVQNRLITENADVK
jgi:hypothetical protein